MEDQSEPIFSLEAEQAVLGSMLIDPRALEIAADLLKPEMFFPRSHAVIYAALLRLSETGSGVDQITLTEELKKTGELDTAGGITYLARLVAEVATSANVRYYIPIIQESYARRTLETMGQSLTQRAADPMVSLSALTQEADDTLLNLAGGPQAGAGFAELSVVLSDAFERMDVASRSRETLVGLSTGLSDLDYRTAGLTKQDLILLAARPSQGKSSLALQIARHVAENHADQGMVAIFSLEMSRLTVAYRMLSNQLQIEFNRLRLGRLTDEEWVTATRNIGRIAQLPIQIDDSGGLSIAQVRARLRRLRRQQPISLVVVDYLQLMVEEGERNREREISRISGGLKSIAKELDVPMLALSQLSRASESRVGKRPQLSDLRDSGSLEQDSDVVIFIHNQFRAGIPGADQNVADILIAKQRNGPTGDFLLRWDERYTRFSDLAPDYRQDEEETQPPPPNWQSRY